MNTVNPNDELEATIAAHDPDDSPLLTPPPEVSKFPALDSQDCAKVFIDNSTGWADDRYWIVLRWAWIRHGGSFSRANVVKEVFTAQRERRNYLMTSNEQKILSQLPTEVTVYQGGCVNDAGMKWSWSLKKQLAKDFAMKHFPNGPRLVVGNVSKAAIFAYLADYDESEVIINPDSVVEKSYCDDYATTGPLSALPDPES